VSESVSGMGLVRRVVAERRRLLIPLSLALFVNAGVYGLFVYPLSQRVADIEQRDQAAEQGLGSARREHTQASWALTGKARASTELASFYGDVLPQGLSGARRLTYLRLAQLARESGLDLRSSSATLTAPRGSTLMQLGVKMVLSGSWPDVRTLIHALETAPEFVVIDNVELAEGTEEGSLVLTLALSTYYRDSAP
jgi:hypothetical protein